MCVQCRRYWLCRPDDCSSMNSNVHKYPSSNKEQVDLCDTDIHVHMIIAITLNYHMTPLTVTTNASTIPIKHCLISNS